MRRRFALPRSMRARLTVVATLFVATTLVLTSVVFVALLERSLVGQTREEAETLVDSVAQYVEEGKELPATVMNEVLTAGMIVDVLDESGQSVGLNSPASIKSGEIRSSSPGATAGLGSGTGGGGSASVGKVGSDQVIVRKTVAAPDGKREIVAITPLATVARSVDTTVRALWIGTPLLIVAVSIIAWTLIGRALRPIEALRAQADSISHATLRDRLPVATSGDEVERLARTLNDMLERLERAALRQSEFVSDAAHELNSPLVSMHTALDVARAYPTTVDTPTMVDALLQEVQRLKRLVASLLELARVDDGTRVQGALVDLGAIVRTRVPIGVRCEAVSAVVRADEQQLESVVQNLVDNARHHAVSAVHVSVVVEDDDAVLTIDDDGPGIPLEQRERIFERFARLDEGRSRNDGGSGIGLALVKRIVQHHGGTVRVDDSPNGGARFEVRLPLAESNW